MSELISRLENEMPYAQLMGITYELDGNDEFVGKMAFQDHLIGNPIVPALHGGGIAGFLEVVALTSLIHNKLKQIPDFQFNRFPKTINITTDYLRPGLAKDSFAKADIHRMGRRYATVHVLSWQDDIKSPIAECVCHFLIADWNDL